jgi:hypothetical protein
VHLAIDGILGYGANASVMGRNPIHMCFMNFKNMRRLYGSAQEKGKDEGTGPKKKKEGKEPEAPRKRSEGRRQGEIKD